MAYAFATDDEDKPVMSFADDTSKIVPPLDIVEARAAQAHFGLGDGSPGADSIRQTILSGDENTLRQSVARDTDLQYQEYKQNLIAKIAQQQGRNLTYDEMDIVHSLTAHDIRTDPSTILEKKFADKYVNTLITNTQPAWDVKDMASILHETEIASSVVTSTQFFKNRAHDLEAEWQATGWIPAIADFVGQAIPFLPWWRQKFALENRKGVEFLMGQTMAENVQYLYALPFEQRRVEYEKAITYLKGKNMLDAKAFAQAMVAFPTSDEYLANALSIADYGTAAGFAIKQLTRLGGKAVTAAVDAGAKEAAPAVAPITKVPDAGPMPGKQLDLFGEQPAQGEFHFNRFGPDPEQRRPPTDAEVPGKLRATYEPYAGRAGSGEGEKSFQGPYRDALGRARRKSEQLAMDVNVPAPAQGALDLGGRTATEAEKYAAAGRVIDIGIGLPPPSQTVQEVKHALADIVKATEGAKPDVQAILSAAGDTEKAGLMGAIERLMSPVGASPINLAKELPTLANPGGFLNGSKVLGRDRAHKMTAELKKQGEDLINVLAKATRVTTLTQEALAKAVVKAEASLRKEYGKRLNDGVLDVTFTPAEMHPANVSTVSLRVGKLDGNAFSSKAEALLHQKDIYKLGDGEAFVQQQGNSWYLDIPRHINEKDDEVRKLMVVPGNMTPGGMFKMLTNRLLSAENLLSKFQNQQRSVATHAPQEVQATIRSVIKADIESLSRADRRAVEDILRLNRDMPHPTLPGERGAWYNTATEFETAFLDRHGHIPSPEQLKAYDTYRRLNDYDYVFRTLNAYRDKARQGVERWSYRFKDEAGASQSTPIFEGIAHDKMPWGVPKADMDAGIWVYNSSTNTGRYRYKFDIPAAERAEIDKMISDEGYRVIQVFEPRKHPLDGIATRADGGFVQDQVNYIITNQWDRKALDWKQLDYRPGGHVIYRGQWYVAQPVIQAGRTGKNSYLGDNNLINITSEAEARQWASRLDAARILKREGRDTELNDFLAATLPYTRKQFDALNIDLNHPIAFKEAGRNTIDTVASLKTQYPDLVDVTRSIHDPSNFMDKSFLADRDAVINTINQKGSVLQLAPAEQLDPYIALNKAMGQSLRNTWMNDYKVQAIESWLREFAPVMKPNEGTLANHPTFFLYNAQWNENAADKAMLAAGKAAQRAIVNFLGARSEIGQTTNHIQTKLMNSVFNVGGTKAAQVVDNLSAIQDPVTFLRATAFHTKLGLFNPVQLFVQAQSMTHILGVAGPVNGLPGIAAGMLSRFAAHNPNHIDALATVASKMGWKADDFKAMYDNLRETGLYQVAGEAALRDDVFDPKLFQGAVGSFLDKGAMFFNEGERLVRLSAYATAWREFKAANPAKTIGYREQAEIQERTKTLFVNMTRDSNAAWQQGVFSVPTQFMAFNARMMEQLLGGALHDVTRGRLGQAGQLTGAEKLRALSVYSAMYGIPIGAGAAIGVVPVYDDVKEEAIRRGIDLHDGYLKGMTEGLASLAVSWATGRDYNVAQRFGPGNNTTIRDILNGDKSFMEIVLGASGTILGDVIKTTYPFQYYAASVFTETGEYPVKATDWMNLARNISSVDLGTKAALAVAYGKWYTKTGTSVGPADSMDAMMAILGLTPQSVTDVFHGIKALKGQTDAQDKFEKDAMANFRTGLQLGAAGDAKGLQDYFTRARTSMLAGDFSYTDQARIFDRASQTNGDLVDKVNWDLVRKSTNSQFMPRLNRFNQNKKAP